MVSIAKQKYNYLHVHGFVAERARGNACAFRFIYFVPRKKTTRIVMHECLNTSILHRLHRRFKERADAFSKAWMFAACGLA